MSHSVYHLYKSNATCAECSEDNGDLLDFAHYEREQKHRRLKSGGWNSMTADEVVKEMTLGRFLCRKCHIKETVLENQIIRESKKPTGVAKRCCVCKQNVDLSKYHKNKCKKGGFEDRCVYCKYDSQEQRKNYIQKRKREIGYCSTCQIPVENVEYFEFDHVENKKRNVGSMIQYSYTSIEKEISKCQLRCIPCHRKVTLERRIKRGLVYEVSSQN